MINLICGPNGSGKTQKLIDIANEELEKTDGLVVYLDATDAHRLGISKQIRLLEDELGVEIFINVKDCDIDSADKFIGMICGLIAGNYDINRIFIDNIMKATNAKDTEEVEKILLQIHTICDKNDIQCFIVFNEENVWGLELKAYNML